MDSTMRGFRVGDLAEWRGVRYQAYIRPLLIRQRFHVSGNVPIFETFFLRNAFHPIGVDHHFLCSVVLHRVLASNSCERVAV